MKKKLIFGVGMITALSMVSCYPPKTVAPVAPVIQPKEEEKKKVVKKTTPKKKKSTYTKPKPKYKPKPKPETTASASDYDTTDSSIPQPTEVGGLTIPKETPTLAPDNLIPDLPALTTPDLPTLAPIGAPSTSSSFPFASAVPGKPGFVYNPYNQKLVDVKGLPSGKLVSDPRDATHKFYVP